MSNVHIRAAIAAAAVLASVVAHAQEEMPWAKSFDAATQQASSSKKLIMLDFYTDW